MSLLDKLNGQAPSMLQTTETLKSQVTEPGDPDFTRARAGTQEQVPSAAVQYRMLQNKRKAQQMRQYFQSIGIEVPDVVKEVEATGFVRKKGFFSDFLQALDAPRRVINFAIQDIAAGREEAHGFRSPTASDYFKVLFGDYESVALDTGLDASSGSQTLALFGWEEADTWQGKLGRGIADFLLQVVTDPVSWVTFGGSALGKKALAEGADVVVQKTVKRAIEGIGEDALTKGISRQYRSLVSEIMDEKLKQVGDTITKETFKKLHGEARKLAQEKVLTQVRNEVLTPIINKDFAKIPEEWLGLLPAYTTGGIRIANPIATLSGSKKMLTHGWTIPGTRGLGRKLFGEHVRNMHKLAVEKFGAYDAISRTIGNLANKFSLERPLLKAVARGEIGGGEYMLIRNALSSASLRAQVGDFTTRLQHESSELLKLTRKGLGLGDSPSDFRELNRGLAKFIQNNDDTLEIAGKVVGPDDPIYQRALSFKQYARKVLDTAESMMKEAMGPHGDKMGHLDNYLPLTLSRGAPDVLTQLANSPAIIDELAVSEFGEKGLGSYLVAKMLDAAGGPSAVAGAIGTNVYLSPRELGVSPIYKLFEVGNTFLVDAQKIIDGANVVDSTLPFVRSLQQGTIDIATMNDAIEETIKSLAQKYNIRLGPEGGRLFEENPFQLINDYLHTMDNTIRARNLITVLERNGLVLEAPTKVDVQKVLSNIARKLDNPKVVKRMKQIEAARKNNWEANRVMREAALSSSPERKRTVANTIRTELSSVSSQPDRAGVHEILVLEKKLTWSDEGINTLFKSPGRDEFGVSKLAADFANGRSELFYDPLSRNLYKDIDELVAGRQISARRESSVNKLLRENELTKIRVTKDMNGEKVLEVVTGMEKSTHPLLDLRSVVSSRAHQIADMLGIDRVRFIDVANGNYKVESLVSDVVRYLDDDQAIEWAAKNLPRRIVKGMLDEEQELGFLIDNVADTIRARQKSLYNPRSRSRQKLWSIKDEAFEEPEQYVIIAGQDRARMVKTGDNYEDVVREALSDAGFEVNKNGLVKDQNGNWVHPVNLLNKMQDEGTAMTVNLSDGVVDVVGNIERGALGSKKEHWLLNLEWLARRTNRNALNINGVRHIMQDIPDVSNLSNREIFNAVVAKFKGRTHEVNAAVEALGGMTPKEVQAMIIEEFKTVFGSDFISSATGEAKELVDIALSAEEFSRIVHKLFSYARGPGGEITPFTSFVPQEEKAFIDLVKAARKHARKLGIDPKTFQIQKSGLRITTPEIIESGRTAFARPSLQNVGGKPLAGKIVEKNVLDFFENMVTNMSAVYTPTGIAAIKSTTNYFVRLWKSNATVTRPTFHIRNLIGGVWNNMIIGVGVKDYAAVRHGAMKIRHQLRKGKTLEEALNSIADPKTRSIFRAAWDSGLLDLSFSTSEFRALSKKERGKIAKRVSFVNPLDPEDFVLTRGGAFFMESIEDFMRLAAFHAWYDPQNPASASLAREMALAAHFDYKHLTEFESKIKAFVPFFVWSRNNIPLQLQMMIERPSVLQRYRHVMKAIEDEQNRVKQDEFPTSQYLSAMAVGTSIVMNPGTPFWARIILDPDIPAKDVADIFEAESPTEIMANAVDFFMNNVNPAISSIVNFWKQEDYSDVNAPMPLNQVLKLLANVGFFDISADGDVQVPYMLRTLYNTAFPFAKEYENILGPTDPNVQQSLGQLPGEGNLLERLGLQLARGVGIKTQTPSQGLSPIYSSKKELDRIIQKAIKNGDFTKEEWENFISG